MARKQAKTPDPPSGIERRQWWLLQSGVTVEVCRIFWSDDDERYIANVRKLDANNTMATGSFNMVADLILRTGKKVHR